MVLDPFTALSLAGVVVQFIDFSAKLFSETWRLYKCRGCNDQHEEIDCINRDIGRIFSDIAAAANRGDELLSDPSLRSLIAQCQGLSQQLSTAIRGANDHNTPGHKWKSFREILKRIWNQDKINEFRHRLSYLQKQLTVHLQTSQRFVPTLRTVYQLDPIVKPTMFNELTSCSKLLLSMKESMGILQADTNQLNDLHNEISQLLKSTIHSLEQIRLEISTVKSISATYQALTDLINPEMERRARVLRSLTFGYMTSRYLNITEAHIQTFKWVFFGSSLPKTDPRSNVLFAEWLRSGTGTYWISGKPGSGKSTLMKYIFNHPETTSALRIWSNTDNLNIAKYFFWNSGTAMQKSLLGLLQSLVFQILSRRPEWIPAVCPSRWSSDTACLTGWTMSELKLLLRQLIRQEVTTSEKFCFFIDGLDEFDGDMYDILDCLCEIDCSTHIKLCLSSRPWNCFEESLGKRKDQKLYMEELTRDDIAKFAYDKISSFIPGGSYVDAIGMARKLSEEITQKAQGVFLWVALAVSSLRRGIINRDTVSTLCTRLQAFPPELLDFFHHIVNQVESVYRAKMCCLFKIALECNPPMSVYAYSILMEDDPEFGILIPRKLLAPTEIQQRVVFAERQLDACCKGLLEVQPGPGSEAGLRRAEFPECHDTVGFLHQTVRDFLLDEYRLWEEHLPQSFCPHLTISRALIGQIKSIRADSVKFDEEGSMLQACVKAEENGTLDSRVLDQLDNLKGYLLDLENCEPSNIRSTWILKTAITRGIPSYIRSKVSEGVFEREFWREYFLEEAFKNLESPKRLEIIEALLRAGADPATALSDHGLARLMSFNATDWGDPSHARIMQVFLSHGLDVNVRDMGSLAWGRGILENLLKRPPDCTLRMLRQYLKYAADPNSQHDKISGRSVWEEFLHILSSLRPSTVTDSYADHADEFLRHGADPFVGGFGPLRNLSLMDLVGQCFSYDISRRLGTLVSEEMERRRARGIKRPGIQQMVQDGKAGGSRRNNDALSWQKYGG